MGRERAALGLGAIALVAVAANVRLTPPAVAPPMWPARAARDALPEWGRIVAIPTDAGPALRGIFVASDDGAPVVLHLIGSGDWPTRSLPAARQLSDLGFASLIVAYSGIEPSEGERSPRNLVRDARAAWSEALRRAGGRPGRVLIRATSLGTLPCAVLLEEGARPAGVVLVAPIRAETVVRHFAAWTRGELVARLGAWIFAPPLEVDLVEALRRAGVAVLAYASQTDELLPPDERELVARACAEAGGRLEVWSGGNHVALAGAAGRLLPGEGGFLRERAGGAIPAAPRLPRVFDALPAEIAARFVEGSDERERLRALADLRLHVAPEHLAAGALAGLREDELALLDAPAIGRWIGDLPFDDRVRVLDLDDPGGRLPVDPILRAAWEDAGASLAERGPRAVVEAFGRWREGTGRAPSGPYTTLVQTCVLEFVYDGSGGMRHRDCLDPHEESALDPGSPAEEVARRLARIRLKCVGLPDRLRSTAGGPSVLEVREDGAWTPLDLRPLEGLLREIALLRTRPKRQRGARRPASSGSPLRPGCTSATGTTRPSSRRTTAARTRPRRRSGGTPRRTWAP